jgi:hypothetical protein
MLSGPWPLSGRPTGLIQPYGNRYRPVCPAKSSGGRFQRSLSLVNKYIFFIYDLVLLWHAQAGHRLAPKSILERLWYRQKDSVSFEDILRTLRQATWQDRIFNDPALDAHTRNSSNPLWNGPKH